ncbi:MAG: hypothetical protein RLZZ292_3695 [Bacteroidota bacterium]|jgi:hypothetical protein
MLQKVASICFILFWVRITNAQSTVQQLLIVQQHRFDAMVRQDTIALQSLLSDDLTYIHSNALVETKTTHLYSVGQKKIVYQSLDYDAVPSVSIRKQTAIITGIVHVKGLFNVTPFDVHLLFTAIYIKHKRRWQLWRWQSTKR